MAEDFENSSNFATIGKRYSDGISLIFDGTDVESEKHYKYNSGLSLSTWTSGKRVKIFRDSGTIVVEYPVST